MIETCVLLGTLGVHSIEDMRKRKITVSITMFSAIIGVLLHLLYLDESIFFMLAGMLSGVSILLLSKLSGGRIGAGDGIVFMLTGLYIGVWENMILMCISFFLAGVFGIFWIIIKKKSLQEKLPFMPFLFTAYLVLCMV